MSKAPKTKQPKKSRPPTDVPDVEPMESLPRSKERPLQELFNDAASKTSTVSVLAYSGGNPFSPYRKQITREKDAAVEALKARVEKIDKPKELQTIIDTAEAANQKEVDHYVEIQKMPKGGLTNAGAAVKLCGEILIPRLEAIEKKQ